MVDDLLTPTATSFVLRRSLTAVRNYALTGKLPSLVTTTGRRLFKSADVEKLAAELRGTAKEPPESAQKKAPQ